ncbi:hypothetical protein [Auraticoccus monumenti]|uniref:Stage II sporulation protein M n=1 Tax=Auraticoccus monumenti TaxID=675864 RepID=A0A1G7A4I4_9ACTN|nr:hypothetical protein [Auraticoccus monumenti]SDE09828.1 hypothetical protein SAMN04489747_2506 [Auraticoccus monumenti]
MKTLTSLRTVLRENWRTYLVINAATYGALVAMMIATSLVPRLREGGLEGSTAFGNLPGLSAVTDAYAAGDVVQAALLTFLANLLLAAVLTTTLPSLVIPFLGVVATVGRAGLIGMWLAPGSPGEALALIPHAPVVVVEFQAYVLAALGSVILWRRTTTYRRRGLPSAWAGYREGLRANARLYPVIIGVLLLTAGYEAVEVIHLMPLLR